MTDRIAAPVIPPPIDLERGRRHDPADRAIRATLPLAVPPPQPRVLTGVRYGMGSIDASGRVSDRTVIAALRWRPGDRLTITATSQRITAHRDPAGMVTLTTKPYIVIPATLRRRCGIATGDRVLLAATPDEDTLQVYPMAAVHEAIAGIGDVTERGEPQ